MEKYSTTHSYRSRFYTLLQLLARLGAGFGRGAFAAVLLGALAYNGTALAQSQKTQLTIGADTKMNTVDDEVSSILFTNSSVLTLVEGQTIRPILVSKEAGATLRLGDGKTQGQTWKLVANNPSWFGTIRVDTGNTLSIVPGTPNPLGAYSDSLTTSFSLLKLYNGSTFKLPAAEIAANGKPANGVTNIGALITSHQTDSQFNNPTIVEIGENQTLSVRDGLSVDHNAPLEKRGAGTLQIVANGTKKTGVELPDLPSVDGDKNKEDSTKYDSVETVIDLGRTNVAAGKLQVVDGSMKVGEVGVEAATLTLGQGAELDIHYSGKIELAGDAGQVVFSAADGSTVDLYLDKGSSTSYVATTYNTYMELGNVTLNVQSDLRGADVPKQIVAFSTANVGQTTYDASKINVVDNLLGKEFYVDTKLSTADQVVLSMKRSKRFAENAKTKNEKAAAASIDKLIDAGSYNKKEYEILDNLEKNMNKVSFAQATGELHASTVGFMYMNSFATTHSLFDMLRNNTLKAYPGSGGTIAPMNYGEYAGQQGGNPYDNGALYYNQDSNSYGPGVVPIYDQQNRPVYSGAVFNGENYGAGVGGMSGGSYLPNETYVNGADGGYSNYNGYGQGYAPTDQGLGYNAGGGTGYNGGYSFNYGRPGRIEASTLATYRGQDGGAAYGDPGTLIYSAWFAGIGAANSAQVHKDRYGYDTTQAGFLLGLDLFCSCDCRFGAYYSFQDNELKNEKQLGKLETNSHIVGLYHQFGDETVYTISSIRGGYDSYKTTRNIAVFNQKDVLTAKYNGWMAGASFEHGANFAADPFVFSPYVGVDYDFLYREKFTENSLKKGSYALHAAQTDYHSLRGQVGTRIALDLYPGDQRIKLYVKGAYIHEFLDSMYGKTSMKFVSLPNAPAFDVEGNSQGRDWADVGVGAQWVPIPALDIFVRSDYLFNKYTRNTFSSLGLKYCW